MREHGLATILLDSRNLPHRLLDLWSHLLIPGNRSVQGTISIHNSLAHQVAFFSVSRMKGSYSLKLYVGKTELSTEPDQISVAIRACRAQITCAEESAKPERSETCSN